MFFCFCLSEQVNSLKEKLLSKEKVSKENLENSEPENPILKTVSDNVSNVAMVVCKQEDASSAKSDVFDSDSPHYAENFCSIIEPADSSHVFEPADHSDFSQDEDDNNNNKNNNKNNNIINDNNLMIGQSFLPLPFFPKLEACCYDDPPASSCNFGFQVEDQSFNFWPF